MLYQWGWGSNCRAGRAAPFNTIGTPRSSVVSVMPPHLSSKVPAAVVVSSKIPVNDDSPPLFERFDDIPDTTNLGQGLLLGNDYLDGNRRSVLIGINYVGIEGELRGCINDVHRMRDFIEQNGFPEGHEQFILTDGDAEVFKALPNVKHALPTKENILMALSWLVTGVKKGDSLFFHFSGHGVRVPDESGDEIDGKDESIVPLDYRENGVIIDDLLYAILVKDLPNGSRLTAVMDCCHSGSGLDLPFAFEANSEETCETVKLRKANFRKNVGVVHRASRVESNRTRFVHDAFTAGIEIEELGAEKMSTFGGQPAVQPRTSKAPQVMKAEEALKEIPHGRVKVWKNKADLIDEARDEDEKGILVRVLGAAAARVKPDNDVDIDQGNQMCRGCAVLFSGCQDVQTAGDVSSTKMFDLPPSTAEEGAGGACTAAFIQTLTANPTISYIDALIGMRQDLESKNFKQVPELSSTLAFDLNSPFSMER